MRHRINQMELKTNISVVIIYLFIQFHIQFTITHSKLENPFVVLVLFCRFGRPIARSILAVNESVLKFRTVNFFANHNF